MTPGGVRPCAHEVIDAGGRRCGEMIIFLKRAVERLAPGQIVELNCHDPAAPEEVPAWCRITGHRLVWADGRTFFIERKEGSR